MEQGAELVELPRGSKVHTANQTAKMLGGGGTNITIQPAPIYLDNYLIGEILFDAIDDKFNSNASASLYMKGERI